MSSSIYSTGERIFRTAVFQIAVGNDLFEQFVMRIYQMCSQISCFPKGFDPERAEKALKSFIAIGANVEFVVPKDGKASIQMMTLSSRDLEKKIHELGGKWEKINLDDKSVLAIIPPKSRSEEWIALEAHLLRLKWPKQAVTFNDESIDVLITCENADLVNEQAWHQNLFLHSNSASVSFIMLARRAGFYLGCKQDICFFDPRGTWKSTGVASEGGFYNDITAVFEKVNANYDPQNIWITSACGGCCSAAYLKAQVHDEGVNLIMENGFSDLKTDFVDNGHWIASMFANYFWTGLKSKDIDEEDKPLETNFNMGLLWQDLEKSDLGKVIIISAKNDQRLSEDVGARNIELAQRVSAQATQIKFKSASADDPHFDRYFKYNKPTRRVLEHIFN